MKPILVHVHIYYPQMWSELKECIQNISPTPYELYVTMLEDLQDIKKDILFLNANANIQIVENRGFDVAPFIHILNQVNLDNYSYIIKLHTKRDMPSDTPSFKGCDILGPKWRDDLLLFLKTKENFQGALNCFSKKKKVGMIGPFLYTINTRFDGQENEVVKNFLQQKNFKMVEYSFIAGTIFMVRASLFKSIQTLGLKLEDFPLSNQKRNTQLAHIMEYVFGFIVFHQKFHISDPNMKAVEKMRLKSRFIYTVIKKFFFQYKITRKGKKIIKIFKIPVFVQRGMK